MPFTERRSGSRFSDVGYRETDKRQIDEDKMRFLSPQKSAELFTVMVKVNHDKVPIFTLPKADLKILFYGHIFTNTVNGDGSLNIPLEEMELYSEMMAECYANRFDDVEVFLYQYPRRLDAENAKKFLDKAEVFRSVIQRLEHLTGKKDRL